jgi:hypothetical protein
MEAVEKEQDDHIDQTLSTALEEAPRTPNQPQAPKQFHAECLLESCCSPAMLLGPCYACLWLPMEDEGRRSRVTGR